MSEVKALIERFNLEPHPEGGYFKETYRSNGHIEGSALPHAYDGKRNYSHVFIFYSPRTHFQPFIESNKTSYGTFTKVVQFYYI